jgi:hypothetical protein
MQQAHNGNCSAVLRQQIWTVANAVLLTVMHKSLWRDQRYGPDKPGTPCISQSRVIEWVTIPVQYWQDSIVATELLLCVTSHRTTKRSYAHCVYMVTSFQARSRNWQKQVLASSCLCTPARNNSVLAARIFMKFDICFSKICVENQVLLKFDKSNLVLYLKTYIYLW